MAGPGIDLGSVWSGVGLKLDGLFRGVSQAQGAMRTLDRSMVSQAQSTSNRVTAVFDGMGRTLGRIFAAAFSVYTIRRFAQSLDDLAATAFQAQAGMNLFARQVARLGEDLDASLRLIGSLADELRVPQEVLAQSAANLLRIGYDTQQIVQLYRAAVASGLIAGRTTVDSINAMTDALVTQRSVMLNTIGVLGNIETFLARYARAHNATVDALTRHQQAEAITQGILEETATEIADLDERLRGYGGAVADVGTQTYNLRRVLGDALLPAVTAVRRAWADLLNTLARLVQTTEVQSAIRSAAQAVVWLTEKLRDGVQWVAAHRDAIKELVEVTLPALAAILTATIIPKLVQLGATLLLTAGKWMLIVSVVALLIDAFRFFERETQLLGNTWRFIADFFAALPALFAEGPEALAKREKFAESAREFGESLKKTFSRQGLETAQAWWESFSQRMSQVWDMITGKTSVPLPELKPFEPTVTGTGGLPPVTPDIGAVDAFKTKTEEFAQRVALARVGVGDPTETLGAYAIWLLTVVRGEGEWAGKTKEQAKAAEELLGVFRELQEIDPDAILRLFPVEDSQRISELTRSILAALLGGLPAVRGELARITETAAEGTPAAFALARQKLQVEVAQLRTLVGLALGGDSEALKQALDQVAQYEAARLAAIAQEETAFFERRADERIQKRVEEADHAAQLYDWTAAQHAEAIQQILDNDAKAFASDRMSAELREALTRRVALLRKQASDEAARQQREGAEQAMRLADEATDAWVRAIERRAELEDWSAGRQAAALQSVLDQAVMSAEQRLELEHRVAVLRKRAADEELERQARVAAKRLELSQQFRDVSQEDLAEAARAQINAIRATEPSLARQAEALRELRAHYERYGSVGAAAVGLVSDALADANRALDEQRQRIVALAAEQEQALRRMTRDVRPEDLVASARAQIEAIRSSNAPLRSQSEMLEALRSRFVEYGAVGQSAVSLISDALAEVTRALQSQIRQIEALGATADQTLRRLTGNVTSEDIAEGARASVEAIRRTEPLVSRRVQLLQELAAQYRVYGAIGQQALSLVTDALAEETRALEDQRGAVQVIAATQEQALRRMTQAVSPEDLAAGARVSIESIRRTEPLLTVQIQRLEELRAQYAAYGATGQAAASLISDALAEIARQLDELREAARRLPADPMARLRAVEHALPVGTARDLQTAERLYTEIVEARARASDAALADEEARFEASLQRQVEAYRRAGLEQAEIDAWLAAQREAFDAERLRRRVEMERQAAEEVQRTWAGILLGPFADPLERFVRRLGEFRVAEKLRSSFDGLRDAFGRLIPDALQAGLVRVLDWLRDQASRVGEWLKGGLSWLGQQAGSVLSGVGGALGGAGQALGGAAGSVLGALGSAAGAAAGALGALAGPVLDLVAAFVEASPQFKQLSAVFGRMFTDVATVFGALIEPIIPVLKEFHAALRPILQQLYPILRLFGGVIAQVIKALMPFVTLILQLLIPVLRALFPVIKLVGVIFATVAGIIGDVWNALANAINWALGWLGVHIPTIDTGQIYEARNAMLEMELPEEGTQETLPSGEEGSRGTQISEITGPTRDLLVELLRPLTTLNVLPGLFDNLTKAAGEIRDLLAASLGTSLADAAEALTSAATSLSDAAARLVTAVETLTTSLRSEGGAFVVELVQSMEIAEVAAMRITRVTTIEVAQADVVNVTGNTRTAGWPWTLFGLRAQGAA